jgi:predicted tellurium resistance membrane protein TerC
MRLMERFPVVIVMGAGLLGWIAGDMSVNDAVVRAWVATHAAFLDWLAPVCGALLVVVIGKWLGARTRTGSEPITDLADDADRPPT